MSSRQKVRDKYYRQLRYAERKRRELIDQMYGMLIELEYQEWLLGKRKKSLFPFDLLENAIHGGLDKIEAKVLRKLWAKRRKRKRR